MRRFWTRHDEAVVLQRARSTFPTGRDRAGVLLAVAGGDHDGDAVVADQAARGLLQAAAPLPHRHAQRERRDGRQLRVGRHPVEARDQVADRARALRRSNAGALLPALPPQQDGSLHAKLSCRTGGHILLMVQVWSSLDLQDWVHTARVHIAPGSRARGRPPHWPPWQRPRSGRPQWRPHVCRAHHLPHAALRGGTARSCCWEQLPLRCGAKVFRMCRCEARGRTVLNRRGGRKVADEVHPAGRNIKHTHGWHGSQWFIANCSLAHRAQAHPNDARRSPVECDMNSWCEVRMPESTTGSQR